MKDDQKSLCVGKMAPALSNINRKENNINSLKSTEKRVISLAKHGTTIDVNSEHILTLTLTITKIYY